MQRKWRLTNLIDFFEEVTKGIDEDGMENGVYVDFSMAFDKVQHGRLSRKVRTHGIQSNLANWI